MVRSKHIKKVKGEDEGETTCCQCKLPELHDRVFQTVYAAGLTLLKMRKTSSNSQWTSQLDIVIRGLDDAITDLRHSIRELPRK